MVKFALDATETSGGARAPLKRHAKCNPSNPASTDTSVLQPSKQLSCNTARTQRITRLKSASPRGPVKSSITTANFSHQPKTPTPRKTNVNPRQGLRSHPSSQSSIRKPLNSPSFRLKAFARVLDEQWQYTLPGPQEDFPQPSEHQVRPIPLRVQMVSMWIRASTASTGCSKMVDRRLRSCSRKWTGQGDG